jgi:SAM-dependent methyltransferase
MNCLLCAPSVAEISGGPEPAAACRHCGSVAREREAAWFVEKYLKPALPAEGGKVLEVGPSEAQVSYFPRERFLGSARYTAVDAVTRPFHDRLHAPHRFLEMDVTRLTFSDHSFDGILCSWVLPFIRSDFQAVSQLHRCLKSRGVALLQVPVLLEKTRRAVDIAQEAPMFYTEEFRKENGTEWVYGKDYFERLEAAGFFHRQVRVASLLAGGEAARLGLRTEGELFLCFKFRDAMEAFLEGL